MKHGIIVAVGLVFLAAPALGQELDRSGGSQEGTFKQGERKLGNSKGLEEKGPNNQAAPAIDLKNNPRVQDPAAVGSGDAGQVGSDSAAEPLDQPVVIAPPTPVAPPFTGQPREGLVEIERLARGGRGEEASALAAALIEQVAGTTRDEKLQAELSYAAGVSEDMVSRLERSALAFQKASALAGPGELRLDSLYNQAVLHISRGELFYEQIEEVKAESMAADMVKSSQGDKETFDTLPQARDEYLKAREALVAHLRIDWRNEDARVNAEFVQQRLDRLDEIESKRRESETEQKSKQGADNEKTEEGDDTSKGDQENEEQNDEEGEVGDNSANENENEAKDADPQEGEGAQDGDEDPNPESESDEDPEVEKEEQMDEGREDDQTESDEGGAESDPEMSQEEVKLILDRLNELEKEASLLRQALYKMRRIPVERDW